MEHSRILTVLNTFLSKITKDKDICFKYKYNEEQ